MKNIHILPTNKPSRLLYFGTSKELTLQSNPITFRVFERSTQNIYITNDEKIKEGDWMIRDNEQPIKVTKDFFWDFGVRYYKIILTTDPRLAPDVQKIDDEFLEWFVKNPSCERVETKRIGFYKPVKNEETDIPEFDSYDYGIIIPKKEPKHPKVFSENGDELFFDEQGNLIKEEPKQELHFMDDEAGDEIGQTNDFKYTIL